MNKTHEFEPVIGLEVHAQLLTNSKMYCACPTKFGNEPNSNICPVCTAQPGALPVVNKRAIDFAIRAGLATGCSIEAESVFARKNYFYPDLPKGYQISQHDKPICLAGHIDIDLGGGQAKRISITRIHLEEDAGKNVHDTGHEQTSHIDFNRSGVPLIETVSGPDMCSTQEAVVYLKTLRNIFMYLGICDGNMQEGSFRVDANVSIRLKGEEKLGTRTELKNMNSFNAIERALKFEIERQVKVVTGGGKVVQETLLWNDAEGRTESMRSKEEAHDYRYFPEPDLMKLVVDNEWIANVKSTLPELELAKKRRFVEVLGLPEYDAGVLTQDKSVADYFEACVAAFNSPKKISNWIMTELLRELNNAGIEIGSCKIKPQHMAKLVELIENSTISGKIAKTVFEEMFASGEAPEKIVEAKGLVQVTDTSAIEAAVDKVLAEFPDHVAKYKSGKVGVFGHFVGSVMKETKGKANPKIVNDLLKKKLES